MAYADEHDDNKSNKIKNQSLISDMSDQVANIGSNKAAVKQVLQTIQTQIAQIAGQDKATKTIKQINSIVELNPSGRLSQSLLSLAKEQAAGNIDAVNQATIQIAKFVADGGDYVGQPLEQTGTSPVLQSPSSSVSSPYSSTSILASPPPLLSSPTPTPQITSGIQPNASPGQQPTEKIQPQQILIRPSTTTNNNNNMTSIGQSRNTIIKPIISYPKGSSLLPNASSLLPNATATTNNFFNNQNIPTSSLSATLASPTSFSTNSNIPPVANISHSIPNLTIAKSSHVMAPPKAYATTHITLPSSHVDISPVAIVGPDLTVDRGALVILDGSASHDRDHDPLTFAWTQTGGPAVILNDANAARATFAAPSNLVGDTSIFFRLTVTDKAGLTDSAVKKVTIRRDLSSSPLSSSHSNSGIVDKFGIRELYPTKPGGEEWFMNMQNPRSDPRNNPPVITKNPDGSFKVQQDQVSWGVFTSSLFHPNQIATYNQRQLATKGYMQSPNDWKNVEMTGYVKINNPGDSDTHFTWYARGGHHTSSQPCEGTSIKGDLYNDGGTGFTKEQWHPGGYSFTDKVQAADSIVGKWVGFKTVIYNFQENGKTVVREQNWIDKNNDNNWVKIFDFVDRGGIGSQGIHCGGSQDQIITWGGPIATFKWDRMPDVDIKNLSVREIQGT